MQEAIVRGALAGLTATVPMTLSMEALRRFPSYDPVPLPPERVAKGIAQKLDVYNKMDGSERSTLTWMSHFGFGAAGGTVFTLLNTHPEKYSLAKGIGFGLGVWTVSYMGWIPAFGILRFPTREPKQHVAAQVLSHVVWGAVLGLISSRFRIKPRWSMQ